MLSEGCCDQIKGEDQDELFHASLSTINRKNKEHPEFN